MIALLTSFAVAGAGVALFHGLNLPLPWLLGPIFASLLAALLGLRLGGVKSLDNAMRTILGVAVGATLTPVVVATLPAMWPTLLLVPLMLLGIGGLGVPYFRRLCGYDFATAYYAAMPGGLQDMILFGEEAGANLRALSLIHATRILVIVVALPFLLRGLWAVDLSNPPGAAAHSLPLGELVLMVACGLVGWRGARWLGLFGASILGPLLLTAAVTLLGLLHNRPPAEAIYAAQFFIGMGIGRKYAGITMQEVRRDLVAGLGFCALLMVISGGFILLALRLDLSAPMETLLAFSPGGQAEMTVLALIVGADMAFVVAHHVLRIFIVILGAPVVSKLIARGR